MHRTQHRLTYANGGRSGSHDPASLGCWVVGSPLIVRGGELTGLVGVAQYERGIDRVSCSARGRGWPVLPSSTSRGGMGGRQRALLDSLLHPIV